MVRHGLLTERPDGVCGGRGDREFLRRRLAERRIRPGEGTVVRELRGEQLDAGVLVERGVVVADAGPGEQLRDGRLVRLGVLAQVEAVEVKTERAHRFSQRGESVVGDQVVTGAAQRGVDDVEVGEELLGRRIGDVRVVSLTALPRADRADPTCRARRTDRAGIARISPHDDSMRLHEPVVHVRQRLTVGLVVAGVAGVSCVLREGQQLVRDGRHASGERQARLQLVELVEVVIERRLRGTACGVGDDVTRDVGVAVTVATDPRTSLQHRLIRDSSAREQGRERVTQLGVERRHHLEERGVVPAQARVDLVGDRDLAQPDEGRLPQRQHPQLDLAQVLRILARVELHARALPHEALDVALRLEDGAAARLRRVRRDDGNDGGARQPLGGRVTVDVGAGELAEGRRERAVLRVLPRRDVSGAATLTVQILRDVREQREVAERSDDVEGVARRQPRQRVAERRAVDLLTTDPERLDPGVLDEAEDAFTLVLADDVTEQPAEQTDVVAQRLGGRAVRVSGREVQKF